MKVLITGGAGFIGSHLAEALLKKGYGVIILDDLSTGNEANLHSLRGNSRCSFIKGSILEEGVLAQQVKGCDVIFHLAAKLGVEAIVRHPLEGLKVNIQGTEMVLHQAHKLGNKPVIFTSSSDVYGRNSTAPLKEEDCIRLETVYSNRWSYSCSKAAGEFLAMAYWKEKGLPILILRLFNTVGPRQTGRYGMVVPRFIKQALSGEAITVFGTGNQKRCFAYVGDAVEAMVSLLETPRAFGNVFNLGGDEEISINELAEKVKALTHSSSPIKYVSYKEAYGEDFEDIQRKVPNLDNLRRFIPYRPKYNIDAILRETIEYHKEGLSSTKAPSKVGRD
jgi:UDP-glucose 4-epimerase